MAAIENPGQVKSFKTLDASVPAYRVIYLATVGTIDLAETSTVYGFGVTQQDASNTGEALPVVLNGTAKAMCGASVSAGAILTWQTATGKVIEATITDNTTTAVVPKTIGLAFGKGSTNSIIEILVHPDFKNKAASA